MTFDSIIASDFGFCSYVTPEQSPSVYVLGGPCLVRAVLDRHWCRGFIEAIESLTLGCALVVGCSSRVRSHRFRGRAKPAAWRSGPVSSPSQLGQAFPNI